MRKNTREIEEENSSKDVTWEIVRTGMYFCIAIIVAFLLREFVVQRTVVDGASMEQTLEDNDNLLVDKVSYIFVEPKRYDVVIFPVFDHGQESNYIKRIIGLPGETVQIKDGCVYINDQKFDDEYAAEAMLYAGYVERPITLGNDEYFVLGDNRNCSLDSRELDDYGTPIVGVVSKDIIIGKAFIRIYPFDRAGTLD